MMDRKAFLVHAVRLAGGSVLLQLGGCGGGGGGYGGSPAPAPQPSGLTCSVTTMTGDHRHDLVLPAADLDSTVDMTYVMAGAVGHSHRVTFTAAQLAMLKAGTAVTVTSEATLGHTHDVTERCA